MKKYDFKKINSLTAENKEILNLEKWAELFKLKDQKKIDEELEEYRDTFMEYDPEVISILLKIY